MNSRFGSTTDFQPTTTRSGQGPQSAIHETEFAHSFATSSWPQNWFATKSGLPDEAPAWSDEEVLRRWIKVCPPKTLKGEEIEINQAWIDQQLKDTKKVAQMRERLANLGWFMKALKEPLARMANKEDDCRGTFWESRYESIAILDEEALLATPRVRASLFVNTQARVVASTSQSKALRCMAGLASLLPSSGRTKLHVQTGCHASHVRSWLTLPIGVHDGTIQP